MSKKTTYAKTAKKNKVKKNTSENIVEAKAEKPIYSNPANRRTGRIIIFTLAILMALSGIASLIIILIMNLT